MSVATVQQFGKDLAAWLKAARQGETVAIVDDGQEIARLTPPRVQEAGQVQRHQPELPDFAARLRKIYGDRLVWTTAESEAHQEHERGQW